jgi:hypothetical protein
VDGIGLTELIGKDHAGRGTRHGTWSWTCVHVPFSPEAGSRHRGAARTARRPNSNLTKLLSLNLCGDVTGFGYDPYEMGHVRRLGRDRRMESANEVGATDDVRSFVRSFQGPLGQTHTHKPSTDDETKFCNTNRFGLLETLRAFQDESVRGPLLKRARQFSLTPCF